MMREGEAFWHWREWRESMVDPYREALLAGGAPDLDRVLELFPRPKVDPAFDSQVIAGNIERLETVPTVDTGHPFLDLSIKTGLAFVDATFQGDHPQYGNKGYGGVRTEGFPQVIISTVDALSSWGVNERAARLFSYWLRNFVHPDGRIIYKAPCIGEHGQLLNTASVLQMRAGTDGWWDDSFPVLDTLAEYILRAHLAAQADGGLIAGPADEDEYSKVGRYFNANAWLARGLAEWADLCERVGVLPSTPLAQIRASARGLREDTIAAIEATWPEDEDDLWLPPRIEPVTRPEFLTDGRMASYTNYRYYPELLSSGILPPELAKRVVESRLHFGGQFCGMTRFMDWTDDWPQAEYLYGLWSLGRTDDFLLCLYGHVAYQQAEDNLTTCEQLTFPPGRSVAPYCLPAQLTAARAGRLLVS